MQELMTRDEMIERYRDNLKYLEIEMSKDEIDYTECYDIAKENTILLNHLENRTFYNRREGN